MATCNINKDKIQELWQEYFEDRDTRTRNELVMEYIPFVKMIAFQVTEQLSIISDVINVGIIALIDSINRFNPSKGIAFETLATIRIRKAMVEHIRCMHWAPIQFYQKDFDSIRTQIYFLENGMHLEQSPEDLWMRYDRQQYLLECISKLGSNEQLIIIMHYHNNYILGEIAKMFGVNESIISRIHTRAIKRLKLMMEETLVK